MNSRTKGKRGELEAAKAWTAEVGGEARRGQQFHGGADSPDVVCEQHVHLEVKRTERGNPYDWIDQAVADAGEKVPVVLHRRNAREWLLIVRLTDVRRLAQEIVKETEGLGRGAVPDPLPCQGVPDAGAADGKPAGLFHACRRRRGPRCNKAAGFTGQNRTD
jgi:hypothetical protein